MCGLIGFLSANGDAAAVAPPRRGRAARHAPPRPGRGRGLARRRRRGRFPAPRAHRHRSHSHQPLPWLDGRYELIFNGEVYNYLELRERLAREFGAIVRHRGRRRGHRRRLPLPRPQDRPRTARHVLVPDLGFAGTRPVRRPRLVRHQTAVHLQPTSAARSSPARRSRCSIIAPDAIAQDVDTTSLQHYLTLQYVPEPASMHRAITRVESGTYFTLKPGDAAAARTATSTPISRSSPYPDEEKLYRQIAEALEDSVEKHMRADVTVGSFLSGGIDSTAVAALAKRHNPNLHHVHHRLRARGLQRDRRRGGVGRRRSASSTSPRWSARPRR